MLTLLGQVQTRLGDLGGAWRNLTEAKAILTANSSLGTVIAASTIAGRGEVQLRRGNHKGAMDSFEMARKIRVATSTLETPEGATLLADIGQMHCYRGNFARARENFTEAKRVRTETDTLDTEEGRRLVNLFEALLSQSVHPLQAHVCPRNSVEATDTSGMTGSFRI